MAIEEVLRAAVPLLKPLFKKERTLAELRSALREALRGAVAELFPELDPDAVAHALAECMTPGGMLRVDGTAPSTLWDGLVVGMFESLRQLSELPAGESQEEGTSPSQAEAIGITATPEFAQAIVRHLEEALQRRKAATPDVHEIWEKLHAGKSDHSFRSLLTTSTTSRSRSCLNCHRPRSPTGRCLRARESMLSRVVSSLARSNGIFGRPE